MGIFRACLLYKVDKMDEEEKFIIEVIYLGQTMPVSWYAGTPESDVKDAIVCACDCIIDDGFQLYDRAGLPVHISGIQSGEMYRLDQGAANE